MLSACAVALQWLLTDLLTLPLKHCIARGTASKYSFFTMAKALMQSLIVWVLELCKRVHIYLALPIVDFVGFCVFRSPDATSPRTGSCSAQQLSWCTQLHAEMVQAKA